MSPLFTEKEAADQLAIPLWKLRALRREGVVTPSHNLNPTGLRPKPGYSETCIAGIRASMVWKQVEGAGQTVDPLAGH